MNHDWDIDGYFDRNYVWQQDAYCKICGHHIEHAHDVTLNWIEGCPGEDLPAGSLEWEDYLGVPDCDEVLAEKVHES